MAKKKNVNNNPLSVKFFDNQSTWVRKSLSRLKKTSEFDMTINDKLYKFKSYPYRIFENADLNVFNLPIPKDIIVYDSNIICGKEIIRIIHIENKNQGIIDKDVFDSLYKMDKFSLIKFIATGCKKINLIFEVNDRMPLIDIQYEFIVENFVVIRSISSFGWNISDFTMKDKY